MGAPLGNRNRQTHGKKGSLVYRTWQGMLTRCLNEKDPNWKRYGGAGVTVCDRWLVFENFYADMGERMPGFSLDRKDGSKGYEPENCRWATRTIQSQNQKRKGVRWDSHHGKWLARINVDGKQRFLGRFALREEAESAYDAAVIKYWENFDEWCPAR
jgi:hypothetical protein